MPTLTLESLLEPTPTLLSGQPARRICLLRHAFRGHKAQLKKVEAWTKGVNLTEEQAYPPESEATIGKPTARQVLNAVRLDRRLARLASADQSPDRLIEGDIVLAFAATGGRSAEFLAAFEVGQQTDWQTFHAEYADLLIRPPASARDAGLGGAWLARGMGYNALPRQRPGQIALIDRLDILEGLERRLIVGWKVGVRWFQEALDKEVLEIRPRGFVREFSGLLDFTLDFAELRAIVGVEPSADEAPTHQRKPTTSLGDPVWQGELERARGVYIIQSDEGPLYVGAAHGSRGFLGRWATYAKTHEVAHGPDDKVGLRGSSGLKRFLDADGCADTQRRRLRGLRFSIAHAMDRNTRAKDVLDMESWFKDKLGTRASALDLNDN